MMTIIKAKSRAREGARRAPTPRAQPPVSEQVAGQQPERGGCLRGPRRVARRLRSTPGPAARMGPAGGAEFREVLPRAGAAWKAPRILCGARRLRLPSARLRARTQGPPGRPLPPGGPGQGAARRPLPACSGSGAVTWPASSAAGGAGVPSWTLPAGRRGPAAPQRACWVLYFSFVFFCLRLIYRERTFLGCFTCRWPGQSFWVRLWLPSWSPAWVAGPAILTPGAIWVSAGGGMGSPATGPSAFRPVAPGQQWPAGHLSGLL